ncbi:MAG: IS5 family transposase, partial [Bacteroidota bacterium]
MLGQEKNPGQLELFRASLSQIINPEHVLVMLANLIPWKLLETHFSKLYSKTGTPSHPIRLMTGILLLQRIYNLSDERITAMWQENPYFQFFCGKTSFQWQQPCAASDLVHFRKRLGEQGMKLLFSLSIQLHKDKVAKAKEVLVDTTVQEKNITYPTDEKLYKRVIDRCNQIAQRVGVKLRQSYRFMVKKLIYAKRYASKTVRSKEAKRVVNKLRTLAGRQVRDLGRKLAAKGGDILEQFSEQLALMARVVEQERKDKNKVYSLHAPEVSCIAKGKSHPKYEFGSKVSLAVLPGSNVVVGIQSHRGNPHDCKTLLGSLEQAELLAGRGFECVVVDKGYRGHNLKGKEVIIPGDRQERPPGERRRYKASCRRRCGIEAIISHLKTDH